MNILHILITTLGRDNHPLTMVEVRLEALKSKIVVYIRARWKTQKADRKPYRRSEPQSYSRTPEQLHGGAGLICALQTRSNDEI